MTRVAAAIDLGSHTARLLIGKIGDDKQVTEIRRERKYTRLAESFVDSKTGIIEHGGIERTLKVLKEFVRVAQSHGCSGISAVGTGVLRKAKNVHELLELIRDETGISVRILSGEQEALLTAKGVLSTLNNRPKQYIIFDLGGSSTEFFVQAHETLTLRSVALGAMELKRRFLHHDPPTLEEIDNLESHTFSVLTKAFGQCIRDVEKSLVIGTGGTVSSLVAIKRGIDPLHLTVSDVNGFRLKQSHVNDIFDNIKKVPLHIRSRIKGLDMGRADVIVAGTAIVLTLMGYLGASEIRASFSDLLEGTLIEYLEGANHG